MDCLVADGAGKTTAMKCLLNALRAREGSGSDDSTQIVRRKFEDRDATSAKVLLITDTLISSNEEVELAFCQTQEFTVFDVSNHDRLPLRTCVFRGH